MSFKLLAIDVDGTLLRRDGKLNPLDVAAIARVLGAGLNVVIATGRLFSGTRAIARLAGILGPIACVDGSHVLDVTSGHELLARPIAPTSAAEVRSAIARRPLSSFLFAQDGIIHDPTGAPFAGYVKTWSPSIAEVGNVVEHPHWDHELGVMAVVSVGIEADVLAAAKEIGERAPEAAAITFPLFRLPGTVAMLVRAKGVTKGTALRFLAEHYGCAPNEAVAVGDWINDIPMFEVAGASFAMSQAPPEVKARATHVLAADGFEGGGVAEAIRRAFAL